MRPASRKTTRCADGNRAYDGPAPPPGHGPHRYFIAVHAVDVARLPVDDDASVAYLHLVLLGHTLARAVMMPTCEAPAIGQEKEAA
ncbi:MAG: hypothetical protein GX624_01515 [Actinobacteria bacterium]|nr:hypothetical protein [Actinomycetota bacterium]